MPPPGLTRTAEQERLCVNHPESSSPAKPVHDSQPDSFRRNNLAENRIHPFLIQLTKNAEKAVGGFFRMVYRADIMRRTIPEFVQMFGKTKNTYFPACSSFLAAEFFQAGQNGILFPVHERDSGFGCVVFIAHAGG